MWGGNWDADKSKFKNFEVCDGGKVVAKGPLEGKSKPNFLGAFPRGVGSDGYDLLTKAQRVNGSETINLKHHHDIAARKLKSDGLWVPIARKDGAIAWTEGNPG